MSSESEKNEHGVWAKIFTQFMDLIPKDMREMIGLQIGIYVFILTPMILLGGAMFLFKSFQEPKAPETQCWQIQKIDGHIYKLNSCTGETAELFNQAEQKTEDNK